MANTYTQIHIQIVFSVQNRDCVIKTSWRDELYKYITGIIQNNKHKLLAINGMPDHLHILIGNRPTQSLSDLMQDIKGSSSKWINEKKFVHGRFSTNIMSLTGLVFMVLTKVYVLYKRLL
jgi:REP element-mobilizing transposase RayT